MFVINARRRITLFNRGCERISGRDVGQLIGQTVESTSAADPRELAALIGALAPPAEVWQGMPVRTRLLWPHTSEEPQWRAVHFWPIRGIDAPLLAVLGIVEELPDSPAATAAEPLVRTLHAELAALRFELRRRYGEKTLIGQSSAMQRVFEQLRLARSATCPVLIVGGRGSGKEHLARSIHVSGEQQPRAFVACDCRATPTIEIKRLLKHIGEAGDALTDEAVLQPGTLYLSSVDAAAGDVQDRLLQLLSGKRLAVRLVASTTEDLAALEAADRFPAELRYRLSPLTIELPPLRERLDDLPLLAQFFLEECNRGSERQVTTISSDVIEQLLRYHWPGNLDELHKVIEEAHADCTEGIVQPIHLPFRFRAGVDAQRLGPARRRVRPLDELLADVERDHLRLAIEEAGGNLTLAAEALQVPRARLYRRLEQLGLRTPEGSSRQPDASTDGEPADGPAS